MAERVAPVLAAEGVLGQCRVVGDAGLAPGDARLIWPGGMAVLSRDEIVARIDETIGALTSTPAAETGFGTQHLTPGHHPAE